jgi:hypothetical protein
MSMSAGAERKWDEVKRKPTIAMTRVYTNRHVKCSADFGRVAVRPHGLVHLSITEEDRNGRWKMEDGRWKMEEEEEEDRR